MTNRQTTYVVITPVRNEETRLRATIESMVRQTVRPSEWVIVNDGSKDRTGDIIEEYALKHSWLHGVHRKDRGFRKSGGGVVEAFNDGYHTLRLKEWDFVVKLDGDLSFEPDYFERCFERFARDPKLGVGGGQICYVTNGVKDFETAPSFHVRGATKIYRRLCWEAIGGYWPAPGWDTMDEVKANRMGWTTSSFPELHLVHHRPTGADDGLWGAYVKNGMANYVCGYHPVFMITKCFRRLLQKPHLVGPCGLIYGFVTGYVRRVPQVDDRETITYLRRQQINCLLGKKSIWQ